MSCKSPKNGAIWQTLGSIALAVAPILAQTALADGENGTSSISDSTGYYLSDGVMQYDYEQSYDESDTFVSKHLGDPKADAVPVPAKDLQPVDVGDAYIPVACSPPKGFGKKVKGAYKGLFYDNDFRYLLSPAYNDWHLGEEGKRNSLGDWGVWDVGGQFRLRQMSEHNMRGLGLTGNSDDFLLERTRLYANLELGRRVRVYGEYLDAQSDYEQFGPTPIDVNRSDILNLFADLMLLDGGDGQLWGRVGRQEMLYGAQRTISPLDWANTRRTFEGYKVFWQSKAWDADFFYMRPNKVDPIHFDNPNYDQEFMGTYLTYKKLKNATLDMYYLGYNNKGNNDFNYDTFGARYQGTFDGRWLVELEGGYQTGNTKQVNHDAFAYTIGLGRKFSCTPWKPTLWAYWDWAEGDDVIGNGYNHMFPLGHKYLGFMDMFGRSNIEDLNFLATVKPTERTKLLVWYHIFGLQNGNDVPYNVNMSPYNPGNAAGSTDLGQELDTIFQVNISPRTDILVGYSHFFTGDYYKTTAGVPYQGDADFVYTQFIVNF